MFAQANAGSRAIEQDYLQFTALAGEGVAHADHGCAFTVAFVSGSGVVFGWPHGARSGVPRVVDSVPPVRQ